MKPVSHFRTAASLSSVIAACIAIGCGPRALVPDRPFEVAHELSPKDSGAVLAHKLAPLLYLQMDESFPLLRVVAVTHPVRPIIAYHLLWKDDAHGAWVPFTVATDQEIIWIGFDSTGAPTELWTYWHGAILHTPWPKRQVVVDVQWGKHGSLPRGTSEASLPAGRSLTSFWLLTWALPDLWLGYFSRPGPLCFCHSLERYRQFTRPLPLAPRIDVVIRTEDPTEQLRSVFGERYSEKPNWP